MFELISSEVCRLGFCDPSGLTFPGYLVLVLIPILVYIIFFLLSLLQEKTENLTKKVNEKIDERFEEIDQLIQDKYDEIKDQIDEMRAAYEGLLEDKLGEADLERTTNPLNMLLRSNKFINYKYGRDGELVGCSVIQLSDDGHLTSTTYDHATEKVSSINQISPIIEDSVNFYAKTMERNDRLNLDILGKG